MKKLYPFIFLILFSQLFLVNISFSQNLTPEQIFTKVDPSVVTIYAFNENKSLAQGSGVVVNNEGLVVTNYHVFAGGDRIIMKHHNKVENDVKIVGVDVEKDLLVLKINSTLFPKIRLGNTKELKVGQRVYAIGSPQGLENSFSDGIISGFRNIDGEVNEYIQTTTAISPGSSGGALVNTNGELIGICTMTLSSEGQLLNFAIPVEQINKVNLKDYNNKNVLDAFNYFFIGNNAFKAGNYAKAKQFFEKAIQHNPQYTLAFNNLGLTYDKLQEYSMAISNLEVAVNLDENYALGWNNLGVIYRHDKDYKNSLRSHLKAIKLKPAVALYFYNLGLTYYYQGTLSDAIIHYNKAIELDDQNYDCFNNLGVVYYEMKNYDKAIENYRKSVNINPTYANAWDNLGYSSFKNKKYKEGTEAFRNSIKYGNKDVDSYYYLAACYYMISEYEEAIRYFLKAVEKDPQHAKASYFLGLSYAKTGYEARAKEHRQRALTIKPSWKNATEDQLWEVVMGM